MLKKVLLNADKYCSIIYSTFAVSRMRDAYTQTFDLTLNQLIKSDRIGFGVCWPYYLHQFPSYVWFLLHFDENTISTR